MEKKTLDISVYLQSDGTWLGPELENGIYSPSGEHDKFLSYMHEWAEDCFGILAEVLREPCSPVESVQW